LGYDNARDHMYGIAQPYIDVGDDGLLRGIYTGVTAEPDGTRHPGTLNTEHSWPLSDGANGSPRNSDIHHLFPSDSMINNQRASHDFGETVCEAEACDYFDSGSEVGDDAAGTRVFQVRMETRGDIARAHFYFSVRHQMAITQSEELVLLTWHIQDPVSDDELGRNDRIEAVQLNRNPFVDYPNLVDRIADF